MIELRQKIQFLLNKIDVDANVNELASILEQEKEQTPSSIYESLSLINSSNDNNATTLNRAESLRVHQEFQTILSVQSDISTFNDRRSLRSIRSTDSFESCPEVKLNSLYRLTKKFIHFTHPS